MVKNLVCELIDSASANTFVRRFHYSGKIVFNSKIHFGVFSGRALKGVMSFGCPMDKNRALRLVRGTSWNGMMELNRMAFAPDLPKNSESRCLAWALRYIKKQHPQIEWVQTFADATQCGDGAIYRAVGFLLVGVKRNKTILRLDNGLVVADKTLNNTRVNQKYLSSLVRAKPLEGFQIKYIYFLKPERRSALTVNVLPYSAIEAAGARMYKGQRVVSSKVERQALQPADGGAIPTTTLHDSDQ